MSFVASDTSSYGALEYPKTDLNALGPGENINNFIVASSWNGAVESLKDTKQAIISGSLFGFKEAPGFLNFVSGSGVGMWAASGNLHFTRFGTDQLVAKGAVVSKGDMLVYDGTTFVVLSTGSAGSVLAVDKVGSLGVKWVTGTIVDVESFRQSGYTDAQTIQAAVNSGQPLSFPRRTYVITSGSSIINVSCSFMMGNDTILTIASGAVVNTDAGSKVEHVPIMQVRGLPKFSMVGSWIVDGNRDSMTYPTGTTDFGRGTNNIAAAARRTNALIEFLPGNDNATPCQNIYLENLLVRNGYFNGLVFWQTSGALLQNVRTENNTFNGIAGGGCSNWAAFCPSHYRDGVSSKIPTYLTPSGFGDRAGIQFREVPANYTAAALGIPSIPVAVSGNGMVNYDISIVKGHANECNVESWFLRSCFPARIIDCTSRNVGYTRITGSWFIPSHYWVEVGNFLLSDLVAIQTTDNDVNGWQRPTVAHLHAFGGIGSGSSTIPINQDGVFPLIANNIQGVCGRDPVTGLRMRNFERGMRVRSNMMVSNVFMEGMTNNPIYIDDDVNFESLPPHMITLRDIRVENWDATAALSVNKFGTVSGTAEGLLVDGFVSRDGHTSASSTDDHAIIDFSTTMASSNVDGLRLLRLDIDCFNSASVQNFNGVRLRVGSGSKDVQLDFTNCANAFSAVRVGGTSAGGIRNLSVRGNFDSPWRVLLLDQGGSSTSIESVDIQDVFTSGTQSEFFFFQNMTTGSILTMRVQNNRFGGGALARTFPSSAGNINTGSDTFFVECTKFIWKDNTEDYGSNTGGGGKVYDMRRVFGSATTLGSATPYYGNEMVRRSDTGYVFLGKSTTQGDWSQLNPYRAAAPSGTLKDGAGTGASYTVSGSDGAALWTISVGTATVASQAILSASFSQNYATPPFMYLSPANGAAASLTGSYQPYIDSDTTFNLNGSGYVIRAGSAQLPPSTTYKWWVRAG